MRSLSRRQETAHKNCGVKLLSARREPVSGLAVGVADEEAREVLNRIKVLIRRRQLRYFAREPPVRASLIILTGS
jgi:hypothetical protein